MSIKLNFLPLANGNLLQTWRTTVFRSHLCLAFQPHMSCHSVRLFYEPNHKVFWVMSSRQAWSKCWICGRFAGALYNAGDESFHFLSKLLANQMLCVARLIVWIEAISILGICIFVLLLWVTIRAHLTANLSWLVHVLIRMCRLRKTCGTTTAHTHTASEERIIRIC